MANTSDIEATLSGIVLFVWIYNIILGTVDVHMYAIVVVLTVVVCLFTSFQGEHTYLKYTLQLKRWDVLQISNII